MTRRKIIILSILLLAVAAGVIVSGLRKERQWTPPANPRYLDPIYLEVPKDFSPIKPALGKEIEGKRSTYVFDPATPKIRFAVVRAGREYWLESELVRDVKGGLEEGKGEVGEPFDRLPPPQALRRTGRATKGEVRQEGNAIIWEQIYLGVTAKYDTYDGYVKETFTLADANAPRTFTFTLTPGTDVVLDDREGGYVMVKAAPTTASGNNGEELFMLRPPQGLDARSFRVDYKYRLEKGEVRDDKGELRDVKGELKEDKGEVGEVAGTYRLTLFPASPEQFNDVVYPVSIDPSHQVVEWDEALVQVGQNCAEAGCGQDGDIIELKPAGWNWGTAERREFVIVKVPKMTKGQREENTRRTDEGSLVQYAIDYTLLVTPEELSVIRDSKQISPLLDATDKPDAIQRKSEPKTSVIPQERRLAYSPPLQPSGLKKILLALIKPARAATTVTSSIGTASRNYSTLQAWETAKNGNLVTADQVQKGEAYKDSTFTGSIAISGSTTDATRYMWLTVASDNRHTGTAGTGVKVLWTSTGDWSCVIEAGDGYTQVSWLEVDMSNVTNAGNVGICSQSGTGIKFYNNIIHDRNSGGSSKLIWAKNSTSSITVYNNILYDSDVDGIYAENSATITAYNNTIYNVSRSGFYNSASTITASNNIVLTCGSTCYQDVSTQSYNMASDTSAWGTGSINSETASSEFVSTTSGSENLHLKTGANAINAGTDLSGTFTTDIDNQTRSGTWDMGADETNTAPTISSVSDSPDPVTEGSAISFSTSWSDVNGDSIKAKICKTNALSAQNCTGGSWATSTAFTTTTPEAPSYTAQNADIATSPNSYYAFVCDTYAGCSSSTSGTFTVQAANATPTITSVTDTPDPVGAGDAIAFSVDWNDTDSGETVKAKICKTNALSAQNCTGGSWATSTAFTTSDPESVSYTTSGSDVGTQNYYAFVCDDSAACSSSTSGTFTVQSATPSITSGTDTPDPTNPGRSVSFIVDWSDANSAETIKAKICKTDALSAQNCSGGYWATSTAFTTSDPESVVYDIVGGDAGQTRSYYTFVCDDDANCSSSSSGTFSVNAVSTVPNIKVRGGLKVR